MVMGHFLRIQEIEVGGCRLSLTRLSASAAASGAAGAVVAAAVAAAEAIAFAEAYCNIISKLGSSLGRLPRTHYDCYSAWLFGPYHSSLYSYHFDFLASENCLPSYLVAFVEAFAAVVLAWNANFADWRVSFGFILRERYQDTCVCVTYCMTFRFSPLPR